MALLRLPWSQERFYSPGAIVIFFGCPTGVMTLVHGVMEAKNAAKHITMPNPGPATENYPAQIANSVETEKLFSENEA